MNKSYLLHTLGALLLLCVPMVQGQQMELLRTLSPDYEASASKLRQAPERPYEFAKAVLTDVIRFLATDAGISFFSLPDGSPEGEKLITFTLNASPFQALETLCKANGLALVLDGGIWYVRPADDKELIGKAYEVKHNAMERVTRVTNDSSGGGQVSSSSGSSGSGGTPEVDLQGARDTFKMDRSELINDIRGILDLSPEFNTSAGSGGGGMVGEMTSSAPSGDASKGSPASMGAPTDMYGNLRKPKVIWKTDSNTLYVVATRLQHMWVEGYLAAADKPQELIAIEVKFFETSRDPSREFGVDWSSTLGTTGNMRQVESLTYDPTTGVPTVEYNSVPQTQGGYRADIAPLLSLGNIAEGAATFGNPWNSVLSAQDINVKLRALLQDSETKTVSYPRMVTTNNREVAIRAVVNQPVLGGSSSSSLSGGATTTSAISYLPIGTVINILPKRMEEQKVNLNVSITVSTIIGEKLIQGNPYPIASSRVYGAPVELESGYTVAVGGLDEARETEGETGVPVLSKIPLLGYAFKSKNRSKNHKNLMIFITPTLIDARSGGLPDEPQGVLRRKPEELMPAVPKLAAAGGLVGGIDALPEGIAHLQRSADEIKQIIAENRGTKVETAKLDDLQAALEKLEAEVDGYINSNPARWEELKKYKWQIGRIVDECYSHRRALRKKAYY
jgi:type II secretory pathway component GspD/PulD (secretin)